MSFITLENKLGTKAILCTVGASIYDIRTLDKNNKEGSIVITTKDPNEFPGCDSFFGKTIGRTGGRVTGGTFVLNDVEYHIPSVDPNGLHGGKDTLSYKDFSYKLAEDNEAYICIMNYVSKDLESGYPGNLNLTVTYKLYKDENKLSCNYYATTDKDTLLNLSNHAYFNLNAEGGLNALNHTLYIKADKMESVKNALPNAIVDCPENYSFKTPHLVAKYVYDQDIKECTNGYDNPYILDETGLDKKNIVLSDYVTGRVLTVSTTYPVVVMYTCNYCEDIVVNTGKKLAQHDAVCLECMYHPNTINSDFLTDKKDILKAGSVYDETIVFAFSVNK